MKHHIITFGCQMNKSDSERITSVLENMGYRQALNMDKADLIVVNMCSVRQSAVDRVYGLIQKFKKLKAEKENFKTILTGCILKKDRPKFAKGFDQILRFKDLLKHQPTEPRDSGAKVKKRFTSSTKYQDKSVAFVPISNGCNNFCSYCVVPFTRGSLICRDHNEILEEVKNLVKKGLREIWLLGQNVNDYTSPTNSTVNFARLLRMVNNIPGSFWIRFISPNPKNFSEELIDVMANSEKVAKYLNLPVQSGDNEILKKMNRPYTVSQYKNLVKKIRKKIPNINLSTDVIVGFPGETKKQFENTVKLFKEIKFNIAYFAKYSPRPDTLAWQMKDDVPLAEKKKREKILREILKNIHPVKPPIKSFNRGIPPSAELFNRVNKKLIVILGPTASGKSDLAVKLARKFKGEIVSADSRQVYKEMDIGTGKVTKKERKEILYYLIDIKNPNQIYTVWQYKKEAIKAINKIIKKGESPFLVGGTGLYLKAVIENLEIPRVKPDWKLRKSLELKIKTRGLKSLYDELIKIDPEAAYIVDSQNPRRIIRALEVAIKTKKPFSQQRKKGKPLFNFLEIGISLDKEKLKENIEKRVDKMMKMGLVKEVKNLIKIYDENLPTFDAIGYREIIDYLNKKNSLTEAIKKIKKNTWHFAKRQMTWFKKDERIIWVKNLKEAEKLVKEFLEN